MALSLVVTSCDKDEEEPEQPQQTAPTNNITVPGADATLIAVKSNSLTETPIGTFPIEIGTAVAVFFENQTNFIDVGTVKLNQSALSKYDNNSYVFTPGLTEPTGLDLSGSISWEVAGNASFSGFSYTPTNTFPNVGNITSAGTVTKSDGYTISIAEISGADSILYQIGGVVKMQAGNIVNCQFTSAELSGLSNGTNVAQAAALNYKQETLDGKNVYFLKEAVSTKTVTIE